MEAFLPIDAFDDPFTLHARAVAGGGAAAPQPQAETVANATADANMNAAVNAAVNVAADAAAGAAAPVLAATIVGFMISG